MSAGRSAAERGGEERQAQAASAHARIAQARDRTATVQCRRMRSRRWRDVGRTVGDRSPLTALQFRNRPSASAILSSATVKFWNGSLPVNQKRRPQHRREGPQRRVVLAHRLDIVAAGDRDAVFGAFELRLQRQEILVGLEVRIVLDDGQQPRQRAGQAGLALLECLEGLRDRSASPATPSPASPWRAPRPRLPAHPFHARRSP